MLERRIVRTLYPQPRLSLLEAKSNPRIGRKSFQDLAKARNSVHCPPGTQGGRPFNELPPLPPRADSSLIPFLCPPQTSALRRWGEGGGGGREGGVMSEIKKTSALGNTKNILLKKLKEREEERKAMVWFP